MYPQFCEDKIKKIKILMKMIKIDFAIGTIDKKVSKML
jgi:hypothetical protein